MKCANCGKEVPDSAKVCGYCGHKIEKPLCPNCGKEMTATAKVCGYCGTSLVKKTAAAKPAPAKKAPVKKVKVKGASPKPAPAKKARVKKAPAKAAVAKTTKLPKWVLPVGLAAAALAAVILFFVLSPGSQQESGGNDFSKLAGTWSGEAGDSDGSFNITFKLKDGCSLYMVCGTFSIPQWGCSSDISFISVDGDKYEFRVTTLYGCEDDAKAYEEWLRPVGSSKLEYYSRGNYGESQGTLTKQ